ncbi:hypothetical protein D9M69_709780 [compost metagenome]
MRRDQQLGAVARALAQADHVAFGVDLRVGQAECLHACQEGFGALVFLEGRRLDLGQRLQFVDRAFVIGLDRFQQLADCGRGHELGVGLVDRRADLRGCGRNGLALRVNDGHGAQRGQDEGCETKRAG